MARRKKRAKRFSAVTGRRPGKGQSGFLSQRRFAIEAFVVRQSSGYYANACIKGARPRTHAGLERCGSANGRTATSAVGAALAKLSKNLK